MNWDIRFLEMAKLVSTWSKDPSTKTGAVLVGPDQNILGIGHNDFPKRLPGTEEIWNNREEKYSRVVHCEVNALISAGRPLVNATLYTYPFLSCDRCCVQMIQAGVIRFVAPRATEDQLVRWGAAFEKVKRYCVEAKIPVVEYIL